MNIGLSMRKYHRWISTICMVVIFYLSVTGLLVIYTQIGNPESTRPIADEFRPAAAAPAPAAALGDVLGDVLGDASTIQQMVQTVLNAAQQRLPEATARSLRLQLTQQNGTPIGIVTLQSDNTQRLAFNALTGAAVDAPPPNTNGGAGMGMGGMAMGMGGEAMGMGMGGMEMGMGMGGLGAGPGGMGSEAQGNFLLRNAQGIHSGEFFGSVPQWIVLLTGIGMVVLSITGIWIYVDMINRRRKNGRTGWFWE